MDKKQFLEKYGMSDGQFSGEREISSDLDLGTIDTIPEGFNPTVRGDLRLGKSTNIPKNFTPKIDGSLYLECVEEISEGFSPFVKRHMVFGSDLKKIPDNFNISVGGGLGFSGHYKTIPKGFSPVSGADLHISADYISEDFNPVVGGSLVFGYQTKKIHDNFSINVGSDLVISKLETEPIGFSPTVGRSLIISDWDNTPPCFNPLVNGDIYLSAIRSPQADYDRFRCSDLQMLYVDWLPVGFERTFSAIVDKSTKYCGIKKIRKISDNSIYWEEKKYAKFDGVFCEIINSKDSDFDGEECMCYEVRKINHDQVFYIFKSRGIFAYGATVADTFLHLEKKINVALSLLANGNDINNLKLKAAKDELAQIRDKCNGETDIHLLGSKISGFIV